jgi:hypothetical protein
VCAGSSATYSSVRLQVETRALRACAACGAKRLQRRHQLVGENTTRPRRSAVRSNGSARGPGRSWVHYKIHRLFKHLSKRSSLEPHRRLWHVLNFLAPARRHRPRRCVAGQVAVAQRVAICALVATYAVGERLDARRLHRRPRRVRPRRQDGGPTVPWCWPARRACGGPASGRAAVRRTELPRGAQAGATTASARSECGYAALMVTSTI